MLEEEQEVGNKPSSQVLAKYRDQNNQIIEFRATMDFDDNSDGQEQDDQPEEVDTYNQPSTDMGGPSGAVKEVHSSQLSVDTTPKKPVSQQLSRQAANTARLKSDSLPAERDAKTVQEELEQARKLAKEKRDLEQQAWHKRNDGDDDIEESTADDLVELFGTEFDEDPMNIDMDAGGDGH